MPGQGNEGVALRHASSGTAGRRKKRQGGKGIDDIATEFTETVHKLDSASMSGAGYVTVKTPKRHVRTRLYFTSESHVHALVNVLRCSASLDPQLADVLSPDGQAMLGATPELDYCTHIVVRLYERLDVPPSSRKRHRAEILFSPGACVDPLTQKARAPVPTGGGGRAGSPARQASRAAAGSSARESSFPDSVEGQLEVHGDSEDVGSRTADEAVAATKAAHSARQLRASKNPRQDAAVGARAGTGGAGGHASGHALPKHGTAKSPSTKGAARHSSSALRYLAPLPMVPLATDVSLPDLEALLSGSITRFGDSPATDDHRKVRQKTPMDMADAKMLLAAASGALS